MEILEIVIKSDILDLNKSAVTWYPPWPGERSLTFWTVNIFICNMKMSVFLKGIWESNEIFQDKEIWKLSLGDSCYYHSLLSWASWGCSSVKRLGSIT